MVTNQRILIQILDPFVSGKVLTDKLGPETSSNVYLKTLWELSSRSIENIYPYFKKKKKNYFTKHNESN